MLKNIFYAALFIALVIGLSLALHTFTVQRPYDDAELRAKINKLSSDITSLEALEERIAALEAQVEKQREAAAAPLLISTESNVSLSKVLLQTLNCKHIALNHSPNRLLTELGLLEEMIKQLPIEKDTLVREVGLARSETVAQIPSAPERLEIIWKLLLYALP